MSNSPPSHPVPQLIAPRPMAVRAAGLLGLIRKRGTIPLGMVIVGMLILLTLVGADMSLLHVMELVLGIALVFFGMGRFFMMLRGGARDRPARRKLPARMIQNDPAPCIISAADGRVLAHNAKAKLMFATALRADRAEVTGCLAAFVASPAALVARMTARALSQGHAVDDVQSMGQNLRITAMKSPLGDDVFWRFDIATGTALKGGGADGISLPMLTANREGVVLFGNHALRQLLGRRPKNLHEIAPPELWRTGEQIEITTPSGPGLVMLVELPSAGQRREIYLLPLPHAAFGSAKKGADYDTIPVALGLFAPDGALRFANAAARQVLGPLARDGAFFHEIFDALGRPASDWLTDVIEERLPTGSQVVRLGKNPAEGPSIVQLTLRRMVDNARPMILAVIQDANALKTLEAQFVQSQKMQAIGQLAGGVAHDFNNLLTAISGNTDLLLLRHAGDDPSYPDLLQIRQNANRAAALVGQLLAFSRKQTLQPEYLDMQDVFSELTHLLNRLVGEKLRLLLQHGAGVGSIRADRRQLEQVIVNLVVNARDAMPQGGTITLTTSCEHLAQDLQRDRARVPAGDYAKICVADTGTGMPLEISQKIFEPFFTTKKAGEGTGLGLSTAYGIVKQSGGFIFVDTVLGEGTTFTLYFPIHNRPLGEQQGAVKSTVMRQGEGVILLVEDEAAVRAFAARALRLRGYTVLEAASGEEALEVLRDGTLQIDLFVSDVIMPGLDGPSWVREAQVSRPNVPVIFVSGYAEDVMSEHQSRIANSTFLPKPFSLADLTLAVQEKLP